MFVKPEKLPECYEKLFFLFHLEFVAGLKCSFKKDFVYWQINEENLQKYISSSSSSGGIAIINSQTGEKCFKNHCCNGKKKLNKKLILTEFEENSWIWLQLKQNLSWTFMSTYFETNNAHTVYMGYCVFSILLHYIIFRCIYSTLNSVVG